MSEPAPKSLSADLAERFAQVEQNEHLPLYRQVQNLLRDAINERSLKPDDVLPPERELAQLFGVSRITIRKAIEGLVNEDVLGTRQGSGTFVRPKVEKNFAQLNSFSEEMAARGMTPDSVWLSRAEGTVSPDESMTLRASPGTRVFRFNRIRLADGNPMSIEKAVVLADCLPSITAVDHSLYAALKKTGNRPVRALQRLKALLLNAEQAKLLGAREGDAGLLAERIGFNAKGAAIEFSQSWYRGDTYDFVAELSLGE
ncbi:GntR family transcriptional regulator [Marinihelvus fidelis]|uniref:GntR family transcriptional regulator n=1 Tax=Marinihelvus fidelis TaxID=2613842 RepID=A0A5N0THJ3_9GAMM|nr:GntR family transcriptional regulator [Marinihelvus fidelis]KAA9132779.1 GntR family transcriptional regulator [Marinihelvus fidelis]